MSGVLSKLFVILFFLLGSLIKKETLKLDKSVGAAICCAFIGVGIFSGISENNETALYGVFSLSLGLGMLMAKNKEKQI